MQPTSLSLYFPARMRSGAELTEYLQALSADRRAPVTLRGYEADIRSLLDFADARGMGVQRIDRWAVLHWISESTASLSIGTRRRRLSAVRGFFDWLRVNGRIRVDPMDGIRSPRAEQKLPRILSLAEVGRLVDTMRGPAFAVRRGRAIIEVMYGSGARLAEVAGLNIGDLDLESGQTRVLGKGSKERIVFIGGAGIRAVRAWLPSRLAAVHRAGIYQPALFVSSRGATRLDCSTIRRVVSGAGTRAGISWRVGPHTLRHSFATHLVDAGVDILAVSALLGHASVSTTQIYARLSTKRLAAVIRKHHPRG